MAAAAPSPLASSVEKTNGAKLSRLLIDGGTTVLRAIFDGFHSPANLLADLHANYLTLKNLLRRRVLHRPQWDLLFPPGGATTDSNTFDITLLFLLLSNICGLSRPLSFWHSKPPPSDTSLEANLARIKFFRNELHGHVTTTGIDAPTFSTLWLEISTVLVALGLHQGEIDRLKTEHCGEEDYIDVLLEWADNEEDIKSQLKDLCQTQLEVLHIEKTTHNVVTETRQTQLNDNRVIQEMRQGQSKTEMVIQETKAKVEGVSERLESLQLRFKQESENLEGERLKHRGDEILKKLAKIDSLKDIKHHAKRYVEGTRLLIFSKVQSWFDDTSSPNRVMVISGTPGMGKSVVSAAMCEKMLQAGRLAGSHFCQHDRARHRNPKVMLQSLASHLADFLPDYKKALVEKLSRNLGLEINDMEVMDLFELLLEEPLASLNDPGVTYLLVIDGLDESEYQGRNELLDVISNYFQTLPLWIRFLVTTRPQINIAENLKGLQPLQLQPNVEENLKDIHLCFKMHLGNVLQSDYQEIILQALVEKSEGVMLYAHYLVDFIKEEVPLLTPELLDSTLPSGISSVYHSYFKRLETDLRKELKVTEEQFMNFLSAVAAAREPLPLGFVSKMLLSGKSQSAVQRKVNAAIGCVSALLPVHDGRIYFFHKSVKDWLIEKSNYGQHHFSVDEEEGHHVLFKLCIDELDEVKRKGVFEAHFVDTAKYALQHGLQHMVQLEDDARVCSLEDGVKKYCLDLELVYARLCVSVTAASEDIVCIQKLEGVKTLFEEWQRALDTLLHVFTKHRSTLTERPHAIFQTLLNEGGPDLCSESLNLLNTRYSEIPYIVHKKDLEVLVQSKFPCLAKVICFDVSPQLDFMVCECQDGTIQLWSLHTGKLVWKKSVKVAKITILNDPYRIPRTSQRLFPGVIAFHRSVVFHPTEDLVLPGILSHAYTFDGNLKPLFPSSKCRFLVCSISADKTKMLTDCPDNAKSIIMWSLKDGSEITNFAWDKNVLSFAWSRDERLLAISHSPCLISLVDVLDGFETLAETTTLKECGMIKFSFDCRFLFCVHSVVHGRTDICEMFCLHVNMENDCNFSLDVLPDIVYYYPREFESRSETGFLLGEPFCASFERGSLKWRPELVFVLNEHSLLRVSSGSSVVEMLDHDEQMEDRDGFSRTAVSEVVFSLNGDTLYVFTEQLATQSVLMAWDISSGRSKAEKRVGFSYSVGFESILVAVRVGVLFRTRTGILELWNFELSECTRSWTDIGNIRRVIPISEERVACEVRDSSEVIILDTTIGDIVSTIIIHGEFVACNSKCHVITTDRTGKLQMQCGEDVLWKIFRPMIPVLQCITFSPNEQYCVVGGRSESDGGYVFLYVLDAASGRQLHMLCLSHSWCLFNPDCKFVSNEEVVISIYDRTRGYCLQLFNVESGNLLSEVTMERRGCSLATCPSKRLIAIGFENSKHSFKLLQAKLPQDKNSRKNER